MNDYGMVTAPGTVRIERILPGPIERVWEYLTDRDKRGTWLASGEMDLRVGGDVDLVFRNSELTPDDIQPPPKYAKHAEESRMHGRITACDPPRLLSYTWGDPEQAPSEVSFELSPSDGKVLLRVTHKRLATRGDMVSVSGGWHAHLGILVARLEGRTPDAFWSMIERLDEEYENRIPRD